MVFDFYFDNTSPEPTSDAETARIKKISDELRTQLAASKQYDVIPGTVKPLTSIPDFSQCTSDQVDQAQKAGAQYVACGWVQKVSNLILNLNLIIEDVEDRQSRARRQCRYPRQYRRVMGSGPEISARRAHLSGSLMPAAIVEVSIPRSRPRARNG